MSKSHQLELLQTPEFYELTAPTDTTPILAPSINPVKPGRKKYTRQTLAWLNVYLKVDPETGEVTGMHSSVRAATVNAALLIADGMVPPEVKVTEIGRPKYASLATCEPDEKCPPSPYSLKCFSENQQYIEFERDLTSLIHVMMAIYARSLGERLKVEGSLTLSQRDIDHVSAALNGITTGACKFACQPSSQPAPTERKVDL